MIITDNRHKPKVTMFKDLNIGDCFEYKGEFYIKMYPVERCGHVEYNYTAFKLGSSRAWSFANDVFVTKVSMEVIIGNE